MAMIQAAWRAVACPTCGAWEYAYCVTNERHFFHKRASHPHVARIAAGKAKRKGRNVSGSRARR